MIFTETVYPRVEDFDFHGQMTPSALLKAFENVSSHHAKQVGISVMERSINNGTAWMLTDWRVEILRTPTHKDKLLVETWLFRPNSSSRTSRELQMKDGAGNILARGSGRFALVDLRTNLVAKASPEEAERYQPEQKTVFDNRLPRLRAPSECSCEMPLALRRSDIDYNGHVHNTAYLDLALELVPDTLLEEGIRSFRIVYRHPLKYGDAVQLRGGRANGGWVTSLYCGDTLCAIVALNENLKPLA